MKRLVFPLLIYLLISACAPESAQQLTQAPPLAEAQATEPDVHPTEPALPATPIAPTILATPTDSAPTTATADAPTANEPTATIPAGAPTEAAVAVNGRTDDGAYFLGRADAPVTIFDYSDFL